MATSDNPLLRFDFPIRFDLVRAEHVEPAARALLAEARERLDAIASSPRPRTFDGTVGALDRLTERLDIAMGIAGHLESVAMTPELRAAYGAVQSELSEFYSGIAMSEGVWSALKDFAGSEEAKGLSGPRARLLKKKLSEFRRSGADLGPEGKKQLMGIEVELSNLTLKFGQNVLDSTNAFELLLERAEQLAGLPASALEAARESAASKGKAGYRLTLQAPSYQPTMAYCDDASIRETMYRAFNARASSGEADNRSIVARILTLRRQKAELLGYANFADLVTEERMAKSGTEARTFVNTLRDKALAHFERENRELLEFRRSIEGPGAPELRAWDVAYYAEKLRRARYDFDEESLRPYFPFERVLAGAFETAEQLYGVRVEPWTDAPVWDASVRAYRLKESDGKLSSTFYVDVFPRESKRDGAWMDGLVTGTRPGSHHVEALVGNFTPPVADRPALLTHREVETTFHEFGHLLHHASSRVELATLAGTNVPRDFVELPSQIMENWCWEREALDRIGRHHETGAAIPGELYERMRAARTFRAANAMMRQLGFAELDLALHVDWDPSKGDPIAYGRSIMDRFSPVPLPEGNAMTASFTHLFGSPVGYAAGYYSYKWAEVLEADAFSRFKREGLFSREVGGAFRASILSRGDSADPMDLYRDFMGREPSLDPLLERDGLAAGA
jgi:oligopeptidase A